MNPDENAVRVLEGMIDRAEAEISEAQKIIQAKRLLVEALERALATFCPSAGTAVRPRLQRSLADAIADVMRTDPRPMRRQKWPPR